MSKLPLKRSMAIGLAGALLVGASGASFAAPLPTTTAAVKSAVPSRAIDVRWHGHRWGPGLALGLFGAAIGAAIAGSNGYYGYYGPSYYAYGYGPPYAYYGAYAYRPYYRPYFYRHHFYRPYYRWHHHYRYHW